MKKLLVVIITAICTMICPIYAYAYSDTDFAELDIRVSDGFYTVITDTQGEGHTLYGIIDTKLLELSSSVDKISSYSIYFGDEELIRVKLNDIISEGSLFPSVAGIPIVNGYFSVKFTLSEEDNTEVFLTGLSDTNVDTVQERLIEAKLENSEFSMEDLDFIDAEKTSMPGDEDNELCWAASASNILHYTGWANKAGFESEDDLLDLFCDSFDDVPGNSGLGIEWFFNSTYQPQAWDYWAHVKDYGSSGGYLTDYDSMRVIDYIDVASNHEKIIPIIQALENGAGLALTLGWVDNGQRNGGHSLSLWGYIYDLDEDELSADRYKAFIISDSDSDQKSDPDRRTAPNKLKVLNASPFTEYSYDCWSFDGYGGVFEQVTILKPYRDDVEYETDADATKDKFSNPDFSVVSEYSANDALDDCMTDKIFSKNDTIYIRPQIQNISECSYTDEFSFKVTIYDKTNGREITSKTAKTNVNLDCYAEGKLGTAVSFEGLGAGEYTAKITLNPDKAVKEAYYYNNSYTFDFNVTDVTCDTSNTAVYADVHEINGFGSSVPIRYEGVDELYTASEPTAKYAILTSYFVDGEWQNLEFAYDSYNNKLVNLTELPYDLVVKAKGNMVKIKLCIYSEDQSFPTVNIYSEEYPLNYSWFTVNADQTNTGSYTALEYGTKSLAEGENFAFTITNNSTFDSGALGINAVVYARRGDDKTEIFRKDGIILEHGRTTEPISFNSWEPVLLGKYEIVVAIDNGYGFDECVLGELAVSEKYSFNVTTENDITDAYDGEISLREAVMYFEQYGGQNDCITFDGNVSVLYLYSPITVEESVEISGNGNIIYGFLSTKLFIVTETGSLNASGLTFHSGYSALCGGLIENRGGRVTINGSRLLYSQSDTSGGAIYSDGGSVTLKNCSLKGNNAPEGAAVSVVNGAVLNMLNCIVFKNYSDNSAIYNNDSSANIVYSTFNSNGGSAVCAEDGNTNMFGSIAVFSGAEDISGVVNVYGCYYTASAPDAVVDKTSMKGEGNRIFRLSKDGAVIWNGYDVNNTYAYKAPMSSLVNEGIFIRNIGGKIAYSYGGDVFTTTCAVSEFTTEEYSKDILGNAHDALFGAISEVYGNIEIINVTEDNVAEIYLPEAKDVLLIERICDTDGRIESVNPYKLTLNAGTSFTGFSEDIRYGNKKYMLWEQNLDSMIPLCGAFE